jgi:hypothetical protein
MGCNTVLCRPGQQQPGAAHPSVFGRAHYFSDLSFYLFSFLFFLSLFFLRFSKAKKIKLELLEIGKF